MEEDFIDILKEHGIHASQLVPEIGKVFTIYGMITNIWTDDKQNARLEINNSVILTLNLRGEAIDKTLETIKSRLFQSGMFRIKVTNLEPLSANCNQIVLGKIGNFDA